MAPTASALAVRVERPSCNLNSSDDLFGKTWAGRLAWPCVVRGLMRRRDAGWGGGKEAERERQNERASEMGGAEDRLLLRTARRGEGEEEDGRHHAACRERWLCFRSGRAGFLVFSSIAEC